MLDKKTPLFAQTHDYVSIFPARVLRHEPDVGLSTLFFAGGELRVPLVDAAVGAAIEVEIDARDVSLALSRPMDVSILNRLPAEIVELDFLPPPFTRASLSLGGARIDALITHESVERLALVEGLSAWAMIKAVAISGRTLDPDEAPFPRHWPSSDRTNRARR
ncbi:MULTISPECIES: TOBE domain-containing protein [Methylosinus]|uniref:Molybdenum ABC transporter ATP-binding protein n=1 Tax=Methylosinus sporium TaxID=428 RepID=A0A2U1SRL6_METSR|nr:MULTISPECIES: TOBE domain-containing protein [Methylosinus]MBU3890597.1 TOBE domain-containing protein [Methylosinus sp. KRF6]PWB94233.1 molybdenum ABC transporter ATP-binding protein [Methylosinus sporium]TRL31972.1 molybdenum ABC transporter ATP-binding protein [Methylosinus sporium]